VIVERSYEDPFGYSKRVAGICSKFREHSRKKVSEGAALGGNTIFNLHIPDNVLRQAVMVF